MDKRTIIIRWTWVLVLCAVIGYFSNQPFTEQDLRPVLRRHERLMQVIRELPPIRFSYDGQTVDNRLAPADFVQFWLRKTAHVVTYGLLGLSLFSAVNGKQRPRVRKWWAAATILVLIACVDEWNQASVPGRTGHAVDVVVDLSGFIAFSLLVWSAQRLWKRLRML